MRADGHKILVYTVAAAASCGLAAMLLWPRTVDPPGRDETTAGRISIEGDLEAVMQNGDSVRLSDLRGKVWVAAQFFVVCPLCAQRNATDLKALYDRFGHHPDFHIVCLSVDPGQDDVAKLQQYADALGARARNWWFLTGSHDSIHRYLVEGLKFPPVSERADENEIAALGRYKHDLGMVVVGRDMKIMGKRDLQWAGRQSTALKDLWEQHLHGIIQLELDKAPATP